MREIKIHKYEDPKTVGDLRRIVGACQGLDEGTRITIDKTEGNQREPGYATITILEGSIR